MSHMFESAKSFNHSLNFDARKVQYLNYMFYDAKIYPKHNCLPWKKNYGPQNLHDLEIVQFMNDNNPNDKEDVCVNQLIKYQHKTDHPV